jgi:hypothetical protein
VDFFGDLFQRTAISVDTDEELLRLFARTPVDIKAVSGADIENYPPVVRSDERLKGFAIQLSGGSTAN